MILLGMKYGNTTAHLMQYVTISYFVTDTYIQKLRRQYSDQRGRRHMHQLREDLNDVQRIMMDNIDDVLQRGAALSGKWRKKFGILNLKYISMSKYLSFF